MPRSGRIRIYIREIAESPTTEKLSFIPPFPILIVECILLIHAITINEIPVVILTMILLILSIIEMILVFQEIHEHSQRNNFDKILTIKLDDFMLERRNNNVKS